MAILNESNKKGLIFVFGLGLSGLGVWLAQQNLVVPGIIALLTGAFLIAKALE